MKLAVIDSNYICYRSVYTTNSLSYGNVRTGVIFGFLNQLLSIGRKLNADAYVFCWDSRKSIRKEHYPFYKEGRSKKDLSEDERMMWKEVYKQFNMIRHRVLPALGFNNNVLQSGYESDDTIAQILRVCVPETKPTVVTSDDDLLQLLTACDIYNVQKDHIMTAQEFQNNYNIDPVTWVEVKKIAGCSSDNVPGVKGVGETKALQYIRGEMKKDSVLYKRIKDPSSQSIIERNDWLVRLPLPGTKLPSLRFDEALDEKGLREVCKRYGIRSFLKPGKFDEWTACFS